MARYRIGQLDRRIVIQRPTITYNSFNEPVESFGNYATVWGSRADASASESYRAQEVGAEITTRFAVRWNSVTRTVNPKDRISYDGRTYNITAVRDVERNRWREIDCVARADG